MEIDDINITKEEKKNLLKELDVLLHTKRAEVAERLQYARSLGDLSENSEYESAKNDQSMLESRISEIEGILKTAKIIDKRKLDVISIGCIVEVSRKGSSKTELFSIGTDYKDAIRISQNSPLAQAFLEKKAGDKVKVSFPNGEEKEFTIKSFK